MKIKCFEQKFCVCKLADISGVDFSGFVFLSRTDEEISLVCEADAVPANATHTEDGWRAFRLDQELDFSLIGIIAKISNALAKAGISVFVVSTYNTDYVLIKEANFAHAVTIVENLQF